jgi:hypothetical protein
MQRPTFAETITALTLTHKDYGVLHAEEEADVAELLRLIEAAHQGSDRRDTDSDTWGRCSACREPWPCGVWIEAEQLAVLYLGRAQDRVWKHAQEILARPREVGL